MAHFLTDDGKYRDLIYDADYRSLMAQGGAAGGYRFGRTHGQHVRVRARNALRRVSGYFRSMIDAIANSKLRRMERELELRGIRSGRPNNNGVARKSRPADRW